MSHFGVVLPANWSLNCKEISANAYCVCAQADDGRRIEQTAFETNLERAMKEVEASVIDSDRQVKERLAQQR